MRENRTSGLMSGEAKRSALQRATVPSSTLLKRGKNNAADAAAICEVMSRPDMRFVPVKSEKQHATLMLHKTRELLIKQRNMGVNSLRGHLSEFGIAAKGIGRVDELIAKAESDATLPELPRRL
jgi:transposase